MLTTTSKAMSESIPFRAGANPSDDPFHLPDDPQGAAGFERDQGFLPDSSSFLGLLDESELSSTLIPGGEPHQMLLMLLENSVGLGISDIHFVEGEELPVFRVARSCVRPGTLKPFIPDLRTAFDAFVVAGLSALLPGMAAADYFGLHKRVTFSVGDRMLRAAFYKTAGGRGVALRVIPRFPRRLDTLGFSPELGSILCNTEPGLILISGGTSCGKSSTLASLIDHYGSNSDFHIRILEDAPEYAFHSDGSALITRQTVGEDVPDYKTGVEACLVHDVNVLVFGELRDADSIRNAIFASTLNMMVLATIHAPDVSGTISRVLDAYNAQDRPEVLRQLNSSLKVVVAQKMRRRRDEKKHVSELLYESCGFIEPSQVLPANRNIPGPKTHLVLDKYMELSKLVSETPSWSVYGCSPYSS
jgi:Tfp pilus assembly pilus retraction ATPase PilT